MAEMAGTAICLGGADCDQAWLISDTPRPKSGESGFQCVSAPVLRSVRCPRHCVRHENHFAPVCSHARPSPSPTIQGSAAQTAVIEWLHSLAESKFALSVLTLGESRRAFALCRGPPRIANIKPPSPGLRSRFSGRILPVDEAVASLGAN